MLILNTYYELKQQCYNNVSTYNKGIFNRMHILGVRHYLLIDKSARTIKYIKYWTSLHKNKNININKPL